MKTFAKKILILLVFITPWLTCQAQEKKVNIDLQTIWNNYTLYPKGVDGIYMLADGKYYAQSGYNLRKSSSYILKKSFASGKTIDTLFSSAWVKTLPHPFFIENYTVSSHDNYILIQTNSNNIYRHSKESEYYLFDLKQKVASAINNKNRVFYATISPDEKYFSYVYKNNLFIETLSNKEAIPITDDGEINKIINGKTDWVYEEEFALVKGFEWSPDGRYLAYYRFNEASVSEYQLTLYDSIYPHQYKYKYPVAGEANSDVQIWIYDIVTGKKVIANVGSEKDQYIPRIKWTGDGKTLAVERMNRLQNKLEILAVNAIDGSNKIIYTENSSTYIEIHDNLYFLKNNSFILTSDKGGFNQIYLYDANGQNERKITSVNEDINEVYGISENAGEVYYTSYSPTPLNKTLYAASLKNGNYRPLIKGQQGKNIPTFNSDFSFFILNHSTAQQPTTISIYNSKGKQLKVLEDNKALTDLLKEIELPQKEFFKLPLNDTLQLDACIIKPPHFDSARKYPVLLTVYGGPGYQTVKNEWGSINDIWYAWLATKGYIVVSVNNRGSGGQGAAFQKLTYKKMGIEESNDFINTGKWLGKQSYVDANRIGIWGWSFGGYMSLMCITRGSNVFKTAIAVAPVTDWRFYDNIYTERYMQRPIDNPEGYRQTSVFSSLGQLRGNLLLISGTYDDNVHPANSLELISDMIKLNKKYDSEFYPNKNHSISGGNTRFHLFTRMTNYLLENL